MFENVRQVSLFHHPRLVGTATLGINIVPKSIADMMNLEAEKSFDDLGYFDFLALKLSAGIIAFRYYLDNPIQYSYVSFTGFDSAEVTGLLTEMLGQSIIITELDGEW